MLEDYPEVMLPSEAQEILGIGSNLLYILLGSGKLKGFRVGSRWRITKESILNYMDAR
jgi:hypothetical protein